MRRTERDQSDDTLRGARTEAQSGSVRQCVHADDPTHAVAKEDDFSGDLVRIKNAPAQFVAGRAHRGVGRPPIEPDPGALRVQPPNHLGPLTELTADRPIKSPVRDGVRWIALTAAAKPGNVAVDEHHVPATASDHGRVGKGYRREKVGVVARRGEGEGKLTGHRRVHRRHDSCRQRGAAKTECQLTNGLGPARRPPSQIVFQTRICCWEHERQFLRAPRREVAVRQRGVGRVLTAQGERRLQLTGTRFRRRVPNREEDPDVLSGAAERMRDASHKRPTALPGRNNGGPLTPH